MAQLLAGQRLRATDITDGPTFAAITPIGNLDTTSAALASWSGTAALTVPNWASTAIVVTTVNYIHAETNPATVGTCCRIGTTNGREVANNLGGAADVYVGWSWADEIDVSGVAGTTSTIEVYARRPTGTGTIRATTSSDFGFVVNFAA